MSSSSSSDATPSPNAVHSSLPLESTPVDRAQKKRGKLPKETTEYLKDWLHRHADHPYPSEEEKKQMCAETGLTMSQVSNWMINARRRILAPLQRAQSNSSAGSSSTDYIPLVQPHAVDTAFLSQRSTALQDTLDLFYPTTFATPSCAQDTISLSPQSRPPLAHASYSSPAAVCIPEANAFPGYIFTVPTPQARSAYAASALQAECELRAVNMLRSHTYWDNGMSGL